MSLTQLPPNQYVRKNFPTSGHIPQKNKDHSKNPMLTPPSSLLTKGSKSKTEDQSINSSLSVSFRSRIGGRQKLMDQRSRKDGQATQIDKNKIKAFRRPLTMITSRTHGRRTVGAKMQMRGYGYQDYFERNTGMMPRQGAYS